MPVTLAKTPRVSLLKKNADNRVKTADQRVAPKINTVHPER